MERIRGTCVAIEGKGVLLRGPSRSGKSDLALRLIDEGAQLVSDDYTEIERIDDRLIASPPEQIRSLMEVRGLGILRLNAVSSVDLAVAIDLVPGEEVARMPKQASLVLLGCSLPLHRLNPFEASAPAKVRLAVGLATGSIMRMP
jgi:serine kinase of HPr protein (carbohydrate metabolism regulator)